MDLENQNDQNKNVLCPVAVNKTGASSDAIVPCFGTILQEPIAPHTGSASETVGPDSETEAVAAVSTGKNFLNRCIDEQMASRSILK